MIGNDIIDLQLAKVQSNWRRPNFLEKLFTVDEQCFIRKAENSELEVWKLWSRKEAAYKIYNRETGIRGFFPWKINCEISKNTSEKLFDLVTIDGEKFYTKTIATENYMYSIAVKSIALFDAIVEVNQTEKIIKINDLPFIEKSLKPVSITHHGRFQKKITLIDSQLFF
ncbi:4'-phosphopantetheinyl transferase family protein [Flavobacterium sp. SM2513]|uniref:4'-phosphopantetheinyl transferase family protein n=1 Tax=Flavobacterium sp. SM2513 TaxID=3424766 RepID=UPI003D7F6384